MASTTSASTPRKVLLTDKGIQALRPAEPGKRINVWDAATLHKSEAEICRGSSVHPRSGKVVLTAECKYYISSTVGINLGRSFLGLLHDIYRGDRYFVATRDSSSVSMLLSKHNSEYELGLSPVEPRLEARLLGSFEKTFRDFRSSAP